MSHHAKDQARKQAPAIASATKAALILATVFASQASVASDRSLPSEKYEQPKYRVIEQIGNIEVREYAPMLLAEVVVTGERDQAAREGFKILARYIFGGNKGQQSIAMTSPVTQVPAAEGSGQQIAMTSPVTQAPLPAITNDSEQRWTFAFMMPARYTEATLPTPLTDRIQFRVAPAEKRAAIRFSGFSTQNNLESHRATLNNFVKARNLSTRGEPIVAFYDDPFTLPWNRRNEWWVALNP
jgi:hypothetical protein